MTKNKGDIILRDRMEFDLDGDGNRTTVYGRIDLSSFISVTQKRGLAIKEVFFQPREQSTEGSIMANTGIFNPIADEVSSDAGGHRAGLKIYLTSRAFEAANTVGVASPDVICLKEYTSFTSPNGTVSDSTSYWCTENWYGPLDLHPEGYTVVSDLLVGVAADRWLTDASNTLELDIMIIAEEVKVTQDRMNDMLQQAQDL
tara:strand:- start:92 stop:694 length:603 start_codon:yes stop_codon:yes gene_type:complete